MTRVSEYIPEIVEYIKTIMGNGMAYESNGSVHFDTQAFRCSPFATSAQMHFFTLDLTSFQKPNRSTQLAGYS